MCGPAHIMYCATTEIDAIVVKVFVLRKIKERKYPGKKKKFCIVMTGKSFEKRYDG